MSEILEIIMLLCFGASWPFNVVKSYRAGTARGKSPTFLYLIVIGYLAGIAAKLTNAGFIAQFGQKWYVLFFYVLNLLMVTADLCLYYRNRSLDRQNAV